MSLEDKNISFEISFEEINGQKMRIDDIIGSFSKNIVIASTNFEFNKQTTSIPLRSILDLIQITQINDQFTIQRFQLQLQINHHSQTNQILISNPFLNKPNFHLKPFELITIFQQHKPIVTIFLVNCLITENIMCYIANSIVDILCIVKERIGIDKVILLGASVKITNVGESYIYYDCLNICDKTKQMIQKNSDENNFINFALTNCAIGDSFAVTFHLFAKLARLPLIFLCVAYKITHFNHPSTIQSIDKLRNALCEILNVEDFKNIENDRSIEIVQVKSKNKINNNSSIASDTLIS
eukprot:TRINITY_DN4895_c0_g1_i1.p1 TRINITY_DN4895_c0_g1~~TRINITY_DN4895_c0_g1_i1.p1  ORF type:complete len:297 (-),score=69.12 TRINITY_DN4895_c0_g1_i1:79-969(-)